VLRIALKIYNRLAFNALGCQDYEKASAYFARIVHWFPHDRGVHYNHAVSLMGARKYDEAHRQLMMELEVSGERYEILLTLGELFYRTDDFRNASKYLKMALEHCADDKASSTIRHKIAIANDPRRYASMIRGHTLFEEGIVHLDRGNGPEAKRLFQMALEHDPDNPMIYNNLGVIALNYEKDYEEARSYFEKALSYTSLSIVKKNLQKALFSLDRKKGRASEQAKERL